MKNAEQIAQELEHKTVDGMYDETWEDYMRGRRIIMKVYCAFKFKPFKEEQLVGIAKTQKGALAILRREFPYMRGKVENGNLTSDANNTYLLDVREIEVEE